MVFSASLRCTDNLVSGRRWGSGTGHNSAGGRLSVKSHPPYTFSVRVIAYSFSEVTTMPGVPGTGATLKPRSLQSASIIEFSSSTSP
jgi:hypothetical protein